MVKAVHRVRIAGHRSPLAPTRHATSTAPTQKQKKSVVLRPDDRLARATKGHTAKYG
jgi:hypothetical protein